MAMKPPHRKLIWRMAGLLAIAATPRLTAADASSAYPVKATSSYAPPDYSTSTSLGSNAVIVALNAQALLLKQMVHEHQSRAVDLTQKNDREKAKWETELVSELQEKSGQVQK